MLNLITALSIFLQPAELQGVLDEFVRAAGFTSGMATTFSAEGDPQNPNPWAACLHRNLDDRRDVIVASRDLPCRAPVLICLPRTGRCVKAIVGERGPYGKKKSGAWRATFDLAPATRRALRHNGYETVVWRTM